MRLRPAPPALSESTKNGTVSSSWRRSSESFRLEVSIPTGSEAEIHVPKLGWRSVMVRESGQAVWKGGIYQPDVPGLTGAREAPGAVVLQAGSGNYIFEVSEEPL